MKRFAFFLTFCVFFLFVTIASVQAEVLAVFPIEDISRGKNGVNLEVSSYLNWEMGQRGFDVVAEGTIVSFMSRHRMRWLGFLDTANIVAAKEELGADLILFGNVTMRQEGRSPASLGMTLYLVRTDDTRSIWTGSAGLSGSDIVNILGINEAAQKEGLMAKLTQKTLETWPEELGGIAPQQSALEIEGYDLQPEYVQRGGTVSCSVSMRSKWAEEDMPRVFFKAGGKVHRATASRDNRTYSAEWVVMDVDGRYPVTMVVNWPSGKKRVAYLGAYRVDSMPPRVVLDLKGIKLQGTVAFRDKIIIVPRMLRREPVARWKLKVEDELGEEQMSFFGHGNLPIRFVWNGLGADGWPAEEGVYKVSLQVWDRANNVSETFEPVAVARTPPTMVLEAKNRGRDMIVDLSHEGEVPVAFWRMEMRDGEGAVIKVAEGEQLPMRMDLNRPKSKSIRVAEDPDAPGHLIKVAEDPNSPGDFIKVPENAPGKFIKVADDFNVPGKIIKVADYFKPAGSTFGYSDELRPPTKNIRVADHLRPPSKTIKVAERATPPKKSTAIKVAGVTPETDIPGPEDRDKRKVEATIIIRDILGNVRKEKIADLYDYFDQKDRAREAEEGKAAKPVWLEDF